MKGLPKVRWKKIPLWLRWVSILLCTLAAFFTIGKVIREVVKGPEPVPIPPQNTYVLQQLFGPLFPRVVPDTTDEISEGSGRDVHEATSGYAVHQVPKLAGDTGQDGQHNMVSGTHNSAGNESPVRGDSLPGTDAKDPGHEFRQLLARPFSPDWEPDPAWLSVLEGRRIQVNFVPERQYDAAEIINRLKSLGAVVEDRQISSEEAAQHQRCINYMYTNRGLRAAQVVHAAIVDREDLRLREVEFTSKIIIWLK